MENKCKIVVGADCYALFIYDVDEWVFSFGVSKCNDLIDNFFCQLNQLNQLGYILSKVEFDDDYSLYDIEGDWVVDEN